MTEKEVEAYRNDLQRELSEVEGEIARKVRAKSRIEEKLKNPARYFTKEEKRGAARIKKIRGEEMTPKKTVFKKGENKIVPAAVVADDVAEEKSSWSLF